MIDNVFSKPLSRVFSLDLEPGATELYENTGLSLSGIALSLRYGSVSIIESGKMIPEDSVAVVFSESEEIPNSSKAKILEKKGMDGGPLFQITNLSQERVSWQVFLVLSPQSVTPAFVEETVKSSLSEFRKEEFTKALKRLEKAENGIENVAKSLSEVKEETRRVSSFVSQFDKDLSVKIVTTKKARWSVSRQTGLNEAELDLELDMGRVVVGIMGLNYMAGISPWFITPFSMFSANTAADVQTFPKWRDRYLVQIPMVRNNKVTLQMTNGDIPPEELFLVILHVPVKSDRWDFSEWDRSI